MKELHFTTNLNCGSCVKAVTPALNNEELIREWSVDTHTDDKLLTVVAEDELTPDKVEQLVSDAGFEALHRERR